jgi:hypothetical protein
MRGGRIHRQIGAPLNNTFAGVGVSFAHTVGGTALTFYASVGVSRKSWKFAAMARL